MMKTKKAKKQGKLYLISYDLSSDNPNYPRLTDELERLGATSILQSQWVVRLKDTTAKDLKK